MSERPAAPARIDREELKRFLWGSAVLLRGQIDASGYKEFIFPLLFFKRISDVYDEQYRAYLAESGGDEDYARFQVYSIVLPEGCHWRDVRACTENVGRALVDAFRRIEQANPPKEIDGLHIGGLTGVFGDKSGWLNKNKLPDRIILSLIEHFSQYDLSLASCPADEMGEGYEYLIGEFANDAGHTAQEFYTNRTVVTLMAEILRPRPGESIYDPTCGSGGMLIKSLEYVRRRHENWQTVRVFGQEVNALTSAIARMNLYLHGVEEFSVANADTLAAPAFLAGDSLMRFDVVLANPPYSIKQWDRAAFEHDRYGRNTFGTPPQGRADFAFIQHILSSLDPKTGRCAILLPHGVLFREEEREIRRKLLDSDLVEAVIGLGPNLFFNSPMEACVLICRTRKPAKAKGRVLFVNAVNEVTRRNSQSWLEPEHIAKILDAFTKRTSDGAFSYDATRAEIAAKDDNLAISLYAHVPTIGHGESIEIDKALEAFACASATAHATLSGLAATVDGLVGEEVVATPFRLKSISIPGCRGWKNVKLGDVAQEARDKWRGQTANVPIVGLEHLDPDDVWLRHWDVNPAGNTFSKAFRKGQVLLGRRRVYQKKLSFAPCDGICSGDITVIEAKPNRILPELLPFLLRADRFFDFAMQGSAGSLSPRVKWEHLADYELHLPPLEEQKRLADKLWAAYEVKESYRRLRASADELVKAQFVEMFGNPAENPQGWESRSLGEICRIQSGNTLPAAVENEGGPVLYCKVADLNLPENEKYILNSTRHVSAKSAGKGVLPIGTVIFPKNGGAVGTNKKRLSVFPTCVDLNTMGVFPNDFSSVNSEFLYGWFQFLDLKSLAVATAVPQIPTRVMANQKLILPPFPLQKRYADFVEQVDKLKAELAESIKSIDAVLHSLINTPVA